MAQKVHYELVDDIDGGKAEETIRFALDGKGYAIDLSKKNATAFRKALATYVGNARRDNVPTKPNGRTGKKLDYPVGEVRAWARANGIAVPDRGRIAADVVEKWRKAQ